MKKLLFVIIISTLTICGLFALTDYENGYLQGYEDALAGRANAVQEELVDYTGVWLQKHYVDEYGNQKKSGYLGTNWQKGTYSSSKVSSGALVWYFIIDRQGVAFKLFENADKDPVKGTGSENDRYTLSVTTKDGTVTTFSGVNYSDRVWFIDEKKPLETLLNSGEVKLTLENDMVPTKYNLGNFDGTGFEVAFVQMFGKNF